MYPDGLASQMNPMPVTSLAPAPDFVRIVEASRGWGERVERGEDLPGALARAIEVIPGERRQALLDVAVSAAGAAPKRPALGIRAGGSFMVFARD